MNNKPFRAVDGPMLMLIAFGIMMCVQLIVSLILLVVTQGKDNATVSLYANLIGMLLFQAVYLTTYVVYTKKKNIRASLSPRNKLTVWSLLAAPLLAAICFFSFMGLAFYFDLGLNSIGYKSPDIMPTGALAITLFVLVTCVCAPVGEEMIFRCGLLSGVSNVRRDELGTALISGICFALMHINPSQTVYQFCLGSAIAYTVLRTKSVLPGIIMHATSNALAVIMTYTSGGEAVNDFYMQVGHNVWITLLCCLLLPAVACVAIWGITLLLKKAERKKYVEKFSERRVVWIDEETKEPIYEGGSRPIINEQNRTVINGYSPYTGTPIYADRLERQEELMEEYNAKHDEKSGGLGKDSYKAAFIVYFAVTAFLWLLIFVTGLFTSQLT